MYNYVLIVDKTNMYAYYNILKRTVNKVKLDYVLETKNSLPMSISPKFNYKTMSISPKFDYKTIEYLCDTLDYIIVAESNTPITKKTHPELFI